MKQQCTATLSCYSLKADDPFTVNPVFTAVWNCMGLYPLIWASILVPAGREEGKVRQYRLQPFQGRAHMYMLVAGSHS